jgi:hypothetical protein
MFSLLDQNNSTDDVYFDVAFKPSNEPHSKLAGLSVVEDGNQKEEVPRVDDPPYIGIPVLKECDKTVTNKKNCIENYIVLGLATLLLITFAVSPPSKL